MVRVALPTQAITLNWVGTAPTNAVVTVDELRQGFRQGLFAEVAQYGNALLSREPGAPVNSIVGVSLAVLDRLEEARARIAAAGTGGEPDAGFSRKLVEHLARLNAPRPPAGSPPSAGSQTNLLDEALRENPRHPIPHLLLAEFQLRLGQTEAAIRSASQAVALEDTLSPGYYLRALALQAARRPDEALLDLQRAVMLNPRDIRPRLAIADLHSRAGRPDTAVEWLTALQLENPGLIPVRERLATALLEAGRSAEAVTAARSVLAIRTNSAPARLALARALAESGKEDKALPEFLVLVRDAPSAALPHYLAGLCQMALGQNAAARENLQRAQALSPVKEGTRVALAVLEHLDGKHAAASELLSGVSSNTPTELVERISFHQALIALDQRRWPEAAELLRKSGGFVANLTPERIEWEKLYGPAKAPSGAHVALGSLFLTERWSPAAARAFLSAEQRNPRDVLALFLGSNASARTLDFDSAERRLNALATLQPRFAPASLALGDIALSRRNPAAAVPHFQRVLELEPKHRAALLRLIATHRALERLDQAEAACRQLLQAFPAAPEGHYQLALTLLGRSPVPPDALAAAKRAAQLDPKDPAYPIVLGRILVRQGDLRGAAAQFRQAIHLSPTSLEPRLDLARALLSSGASQEAAGLLQEIVAAAPGSAWASQAATLVASITNSPASPRKVP